MCATPVHCLFVLSYSFQYVDFYGSDSCNGHSLKTACGLDIHHSQIIFVYLNNQGRGHNSRNLLVVPSCSLSFHSVFIILSYC